MLFLFICDIILSHDAAGSPVQENGIKFANGWFYNTYTILQMFHIMKHEII